MCTPGLIELKDDLQGRVVGIFIDHSFIRIIIKKQQSQFIIKLIGFKQKNGCMLKRSCTVLAMN